MPVLALLLLAAFVGVSVLPVSAAEPADAERAPVGLSLLLGRRVLDEDQWGPVHDHTVRGIEIDGHGPSWPVSLVAGWRVASDGVSRGIDDFESDSEELSVGLRKVWGPFGPGEGSRFRFLFLSVRPALAGGGAWTSATLVTEGGGIEQRDRDEALGYWVSGSVYLAWPGPGTFVGEVRYLDADVHLLGRRRQAGGLSFAFGLRFGAF